MKLSPANHKSGRTRLKFAAAMLASAFLAPLSVTAASAQSDSDDPVIQRQEQQKQSCILVTGNADCDTPPHGPFAPPPPPLPDVWGAIAVSPSTLASGHTWNYNSQRQAAAAALNTCRLYARGAQDCRVVLAVADVCASLAESTIDRIFSVGGPSGAANFTDANAMLHCQRAGGQNCRITDSFCADGVRHVLAGSTVYSNGNPIFVPQGGRTFRR